MGAGQYYFIESGQYVRALPNGSVRLLAVRASPGRPCVEVQRLSGRPNDIGYVVTASENR
jgi:hypothetical protein